MWQEREAEGGDAKALLLSVPAEDRGGKVTETNEHLMIGSMYYSDEAGSVVATLMMIRTRILLMFSSLKVCDKVHDEHRRQDQHHLQK